MASFKRILAVPDFVPVLSKDMGATEMTQSWKRFTGYVVQTHVAGGYIAVCRKVEVSVGNCLGSGR